MKSDNRRNPRAEMLFTDLCDEIDQWRNDYLHMKKEMEYYRDAYNSHLNKSIDDAKKFTGALLTGLLHREMKIKP